MVDIRALAAAGYSIQALRQKFVPDGGFAAREPKVQQLVDLVTSRIREGVNRNLTHGRHWWVIDQACDVSNRSLGATALRGLRSLNTDPQKMGEMLKDWGLSSVINPILDKDGIPKTDQRGNVLYRIDDSPLVEVIAPICQQYLTARWATLVTGRDSSPWLKYSPLVYSRKNHLKTMILTSRAEQMVHDMGYRADFRQESLCALKYGFQFVFAMEPYYYERQQQMTDDGIKTVVVKEGIRQAMPHPSRTFFDLSHRMSTINTDTGMRYAGYWDLYPLGDVIRNKQYWFTDEQRKDGKSAPISTGHWIDNTTWTAWNQLYPCNMAMPQGIFYNESRSALDRTAESNRVTYSSLDQGVLLTKMFMKINPKEWELFDYDGDVWFCFTMANADTPILVEPYAYTPVRVCQYQGDQLQWRPTSMVTDLVPFQDAVGNLLTQYLMSVRRNLINLVYYNKDSVSKEVTDHLQNQQAGLWMGLNLVPVSFKDAQMDATTAQISDQFKAVNLPMADTVSVVNAITTMLSIIERVIGFTAQEVGTTGAHVQTAEEIRVMTDFANNRIALTDAFFDSSIAAQKRQIVGGFMAYGDDLVMGSLADLSDIDRAELESMGILIEDGNDRQVGVLADKWELNVAAFASDREGSRRTNDAQIATALMQFAQTVFSVPQIVEQVGVPWLVEMFNTIAQFAGMAPETKLPTPQSSAPGQAPQVLQQVQQLVQQMMEGQMEQIGQGVRTEVAEPLQQQIGQMAGKVQELDAALKQVVGQIASANQMQMVPV